MPVSINKLGNGYSVSTPGGVKAKHTTKKKAKSQQRLLNAVEHGWTPSKDPYRADNSRFHKRGM